jgi:UDP-glucuronate decarboxylase
MLGGGRVLVTGGATETRSFCYVDNLVEGLLRLMDTADDVTGPVLGNPEEFMVRELAETIIALTGSSIADRAPPPSPRRSPAAAPGHQQRRRAARMASDCRAA